MRKYSRYSAVNCVTWHSARVTWHPMYEYFFQFYWILRGSNQKRGFCAEINSLSCRSLCSNILVHVVWLIHFLENNSLTAERILQVTFSSKTTNKNYYTSVWKISQISDRLKLQKLCFRSVPLKKKEIERKKEWKEGNWKLSLRCWLYSYLLVDIHR